MFLWQRCIELSIEWFARSYFSDRPNRTNADTAELWDLWNGRGKCCIPVGSQDSRSCTCCSCSIFYERENNLVTDDLIASCCHRSLVRLPSLVDDSDAWVIDDFHWTKRVTDRNWQCLFIYFLFSFQHSNRVSNDRKRWPVKRRINSRFQNGEWTKSDDDLLIAVHDLHRRAGKPVAGLHLDVVKDGKLVQVRFLTSVSIQCDRLFRFPRAEIDDRWEEVLFLWTQ